MSLIGLIVGLALIGCSITLFLGATATTGQLRFALQNKASYLDIEKNLLIGLKRGLSTTSCVDASILFASIPLGEVSAAYSKVVAPGLDPHAILPPNLSPAVTNSLSRCQSPRESTGSKYFCIRFGNSANNRKDTILNADYAFAEILISFRDFKQELSCNCGAYDDIAHEACGAEVYYSLYWQSISRDKRWTRHDGYVVFTK